MRKGSKQTECIIEIQCLHCGKEFKDYKTYNRKYCCRKCASDESRNRSSWNKGIPTSTNTKIKISKALIGKSSWNKGIPMSQEHKDILHKALFGKKRSQETIKKITEANKGKKRSEEFIKNMSGKNNRLYGKHHKESTKELISEALIGIRRSEETKKRMSLSKIGTITWMKGHTVSDETRKKISESNQGQKRSLETRKKISEASKGKVLTITHRANISKATKNKPLTEKQKQQRINMWQDPEHLKKMLAHNPVFCDTEPELEMKRILNSLNIKYEHNIRMNIPHSYHCDFYLPEYNCVIECDGILFHGHPKKFKPDDIIPLVKMKAKDKWELDALRTRELQDKGYKVLRFWEDEFDEEIVKSKLIEVN